ncbi:MAG TPA: DUF5916 domain-containing protein [Thermoanaerobaculia bacterium]|nr:DUF5916 domain-containing protein [Thermoanaerobaculia bacterium]
MSYHRALIARVVFPSLLATAAAAHAAQEPRPPAAPPPAVPPTAVPRASGPIAIDGDLSDPAWASAARFDTFYETSPGDNLPAKVRTVAWVTYDDRYFYIAVQCDDPEPDKIRAPFVDRDQVFGTDDNVAVFLDTRNDGKVGMELRISPRGIQGDAIFNDATNSEDFAPDFFYDTAARITDQGWSGEYRIPLTSLRYPSDDPQTWRILFWRNYPRDFRYAFHSAPIPRGSSCALICHAHELTGLTGLPTSNHLVAAPYTTVEAAESRPADAEARFSSADADGELGIDVKWNPSADSAVDLTLNPDFSQVEADVAQLAVNERFALFFPEKRPFFLEGLDLFETPVRAVYTRTINEPRWGLRGTGKRGASSYTLLVAEDRGGGLVILPGPLGSSFAPQDLDSRVAVGRLRHDLGRSFVGMLLTAREIDGGGHNRVLGPDFQWRPTGSDTVTGQLLWSQTEDPDRRDLFPGFRGDRREGHAAELSWNHLQRTHDWFVGVEDYDDGFRADVGFVPQVGYREGRLGAGLRFFPEGLLRFVRPSAGIVYTEDSDGRKLGRSLFPGLFFLGRNNLTGSFELHLDAETRVGDALLEESFLGYFLQIDPSRLLARIGVSGRVGEQIDFANGRVGDGITVGLNATVRPTDHLELLLNATRQQLDVDDAGQSTRLFTADLARVRANYVFSARSLLRLIGQYVDVERDPRLYGSPVAARSGDFAGSLLYSYKLNWQTVLFLGYGNEWLGDDRDDRYDLVETDRSLFFKLSYAIQR